MRSETISELISDSARLPSMMVVGANGQTSSIRSEPFPRSHVAHSGAHPLPPNTIQPSQESPHIRFRGDHPTQPQQQEVEQTYNHGNHTSLETPSIGASAPPPPSPRLGPTHRSALSLNGSVASSPSRIKVRDLGHIQSFASEELLTRSRHPSRHSLRGRLAGSQQYEISAMPVADIIEMVAGLLTKITTTVKYFNRSLLSLY